MNAETKEALKDICPMVLSLICALALLTADVGFLDRWMSKKPAAADLSQITPEEVALAKTPITTNFFDNGLSDWAKDTNHLFGPHAASNVVIMQTLPNKAFYLRWRNSTNPAQLDPFLERDHSFKTLEEAIAEVSHPLGLFMQKAISDAVEDVLRAELEKMDKWLEERLGKP